MINLHEIRYVRLGTRNLDAAAEYATRILGLQQVRLFTWERCRDTHVDVYRGLA